MEGLFRELAVLCNYRSLLRAQIGDIFIFVHAILAHFLVHGVGRYNIAGKSALSNREKQYAIDMYCLLTRLI